MSITFTFTWIMVVVSNSTMFFTISAFISALVLFLQIWQLFWLRYDFYSSFNNSIIFFFSKSVCLVCAVLKIPKTFSYSLRLFFSMWVFFHVHSQITGMQGKEKGISFTPDYHFHPFHRHLDISWGDYCRELTSAHSHQLDLNRKPLVFKHKSLTTKLSSLRLCIHHTSVYIMHKHWISADNMFSYFCCRQFFRIIFTSIYFFN